MEVEAELVTFEAEAVYFKTVEAELEAEAVHAVAKAESPYFEKLKNG